MAAPATSDQSHHDHHLFRLTVTRDGEQVSLADAVQAIAAGEDPEAYAGTLNRLPEPVEDEVGPASSVIEPSQTL